MPNKSTTNNGLKSTRADPSPGIVGANQEECSSQLSLDERWVKFFLVGILIVFLSLLFWDVTEPWVGHHDYNGAWISSAARNHVEHGFLKTRFGVVLNNEPSTATNDFSYYTHHPPLVPIMVACFFKIFGISEWAARLVPILCAFGTAGVLFALCSRLANRTVALLATFFYSLMPMNTYFGRMVDHEAPTLLFALAAVLTYLRWRDNHSLRAFTTLLLLLTLSMLCGWPGYYLCGFLPLHALITRPRNAFQLKIFILPLLAIAAFALHLFHIYILVGLDSLTDLKSVLLFRTSAKSFTWPNLILRQLDRGADLFTIPLMLLAGLSLFSVLKNRRKTGFNDWRMPILLVVFGVTHIVLFSHGAWVHEYWAYYCTPAIALLAADCTVSLCTKTNKGAFLTFVILLVVFSAYGPIRSLHRADYPVLYDLGVLLHDRVEPGTEIVWNLKLAWWPWPQTSYYARREMYPKAVKSVEKIEHIVSEDPTKNRVFIFHDYGTKSAKLKEWLDSFYECEEFVYAGGHYLIYTISSPMPTTP